MTSYRNQLEEKIKEELNQGFQPKGLICEGFLLSEVKLLGDLSTAKDDKVLFKK